MYPKKCAHTLLALILLVGASTAASTAQEQRPRLDGREDALGIRVGSFLLDPSIRLENGFTDNLLLEEENTNSAYIFKVAPTFALRSNWNRHAARIEVGLENATFVDFDDNGAEGDDDFTDFHVTGSGQLDITRAARLSGGVGFEQNHDPRGSDDVAVNALEPVVFHEVSVELEGEYKAGLVRLSPDVDFRDFSFSDSDLSNGATSNNSDRDRQELRYGGEVGYEFLRGYEAFVRGEGVNIAYEEDLDDGSANRDSMGWSALTGVNVDVTRLLKARVGAGYFQRDFDADAFSDISGFNLDASAIWSPTALTTVTFTGSRGVQETTVAGASGAVTVRGRVDVQHALRQNLVLSTFAAAGNQEFDGIDREDLNFQVGLGASWLVTENFSANARYAFEHEDSDSPGDSYDVNQFFLGLTARY